MFGQNAYLKQTPETGHRSKLICVSYLHTGYKGETSIPNTCHKVVQGNGGVAALILNLCGR